MLQHKDVLQCTDMSHCLKHVFGIGHAMNIVVGGTFAYLHDGHRALLAKAFEIGDHVCIGLTTDGYVRRVKGRGDLPSYPKREAELRRFVGRLGKAFTILPLDDRFGPSTTGNFDAIVVSEETFPAALEVNAIRKANGLKALDVIKIGSVLAWDSLPISSSKIAAGEIDLHGNRTGGKGNL